MNQMQAATAAIVTVVMIVVLCTLLYYIRLVQPQQQIITTSPPIMITDPVMQYDYGNLYDPLRQPARRVPRHEIPYIPIDYPTRGYSDNFTQLGTLVNNGHASDKILRLFGRQEYPRSNRYEYYIMINSGFDQIKTPLNVRKNELYDGDKVYVKELHAEYEVHLYKYDQPKYYPHF